MNRLARTFIAWLPLAVAVTLLAGLGGVTVQQNYRQSLNDPQIQMAQDAATRLSGGAKPSDVVPDPDSVDITNSLAPWLAVYTQDGVGLLSSGEVNGEIPVLPKGVFDPRTWHTYAEDGLALPVPSGEDRVTWQSGAGVRQAIVIVQYGSAGNGGFVVAGRNMAEVENREGVLVSMVAISWLVTMIATFVVQGFASYVL